MLKLSLVLVIGSLALSLAQVPNWDQPDTRPLRERCMVPHALDDPRAMEVHLRCIVAALGNPIVLPNPLAEDDAGREEEHELFQQYCDDVQEAIEHLDRLKGELQNGPKRPTGAAVADLDELIRSSADAVRSFKEHLERQATKGPEADCRDLFTSDDDGAMPVDPCQILRDPRPANGTRLDDPNYENNAGRHGITVNLGAHLVPFPRWGSPYAPKERMESGHVPAGGAAFVLKEFFGLKLILRYVWVPIWVEPWTSRARIIGYRRRLYLRWVPCEYLKSIIYSMSSDGTVVPRVITKDWCDHSLISFWRFF